MLNLTWMLLVCYALPQEEPKLTDAPGGQPAECVALSLKSMLPESWLSWYLQGEMRAASSRAFQEAIALAATYHDTDGARLLTSFGVTRRDSSKGGRFKKGSFILNADYQWQHDDRWGVGVRFNYYLDTHDIEGILFLQLGPPVRGR